MACLSSDLNVMSFLVMQDAENWNEAFSENLKRLHVYNFYLKEFIKTSEDTSLSRIASLHLNDVNNLLHQFLIAFKANVSKCNHLNYEFCEVLLKRFVRKYRYHQYFELLTQTSKPFDQN